MPAEAMTIGELGVFFLQVGTVEEDQPCNIDGCGSCVNGAFKPLSDQPRQIARMIKMGMGQNDRVNGSRLNRKARPVAFAKLARALKQTAVDEDAAAIVID